MGRSLVFIGVIFFNFLAVANNQDEQSVVVSCSCQFITEGDGIIGENLVFGIAKKSKSCVEEQDEEACAENVRAAIKSAQITCEEQPADVHAVAVGCQVLND